MAEMRLCVAPAACTPSHQGWSRHCHCWESNLPATETFLNSHYGSIPWGDQLATEDKLTAVEPSILEGLEICSHRSRRTFGCGVLFSEPLTEDLQCAYPPAWEQTLHGTKGRTSQKSRCEGYSWPQDALPASCTVPPRSCPHFRGLDGLLQEQLERQCGGTVCGMRQRLPGRQLYIHV